MSTRYFNWVSLEEMGRFRFESDPTKRINRNMDWEKNMCFVVRLDMGGVAVALPFAISLVRHLVYQRLHGRLGVALGAFRMWLIGVDGC